MPDQTTETSVANTDTLELPPDAPIELAVVSGMTPGKGRYVRTHRIVSIDPGIGLIWHGTPTFAEVREILRAIKAMGDTRDLILADALKGAVEAIGAEQVELIVAQLEFNASEIRKATLIGSLDRSCRSRKLTSEHLHVAARIENLTELERYGWLKRAETEGLSALELHRSIEAGKIVRLENTTAGASRNSGIVTVESIRFTWDQWERRNKREILEAPAEVQRKFLEEVDPILKTAEEVRRCLTGGAR